MGNDWDGGIFKQVPPEPVQKTLVYDDGLHPPFLIVRDPNEGLNSSTGPTDEKGWPDLRPTDGDA